MTVVTIHAGRMPVVIQQRSLTGVVRIRCCRERMPDLRRSVLGEDARRRGRDIRTPVVACDAILLVGSAKQSRRSLGIVRGVARYARILSHRVVASHVRLRRNLVLHEGMGTGGPI